MPNPPPIVLKGHDAHLWADRLSGLSREDLVDLASILLAEIRGRTGDYWTEAEGQVDKYRADLDEHAPPELQRDVHALLSTAELALRSHAQALAGTRAEGLYSGLLEGPRMVAAKGGKAAAAKDERQVEKAFVRECWKEWRADPARYRGKAAFARDMLDKCGSLKSQKKIEDWCREWEKSEPR